MEATVKGLVLHTSQTGEADRIITVLTRFGRLSFRAFGVRSLKSVHASACAPFAFSEFTVSFSRGFVTLKKSQLERTMIPPGTKLAPLSLAFYVAEMLSYVSPEYDADALPDDTLLKSGVNVLYLIRKADRPLASVKAVFELRLLMTLGHMPDIPYCFVCGADCREIVSGSVFSLTNGNVKCPSCAALSAAASDMDETGELHIDETALFISGACLRLIMRTLAASEKQAYAVNVPEALLRELSIFAEKYTLGQLERSFNSLKFYHEVAL